METKKHLLPTACMNSSFLWFITPKINFILLCFPLISANDVQPKQLSYFLIHLVKIVFPFAFAEKIKKWTIKPYILKSFYFLTLQKRKNCDSFDQFIITNRSLPNAGLYEIFSNYWMRLSKILRILKIKEDVIHLGLRPRWITPSKICRILHILRKPNSVITLLFIQNIFKVL